MIEIKNQEQFESYKKLYNLKKLPPQFIRGKLCEFYTDENGTIYYKKRQKKYNERPGIPYEARGSLSSMKDAFKRNVFNLYSVALTAHTAQEMQIAITRTQHHIEKIKQLMKNKFKTEEERIEATQEIVEDLLTETLEEFIETRPNSKDLLITTILSAPEIEDDPKNSFLKEFLISKFDETEIGIE